MPTNAYSNTVSRYYKEIPKGRLYEHQAGLPKLPVPTLEETCHKYLKTLQPLVNEQEFAKSARLVESFKKGIGAKLHEKLLERANTATTSWLIDWWNDWAYFGYRDPVVINVNYFFQFQDDLRPQFKSQTGRAASIVQGALEFRKLVVSGELDPESTKTHPLCSIMYKFLFNACRIPVIPSDTTELYDPNVNRHIAVVRKNKFYVFDVLDASGNPISTAEIEAQLNKIIQDAGSVPDPNAIGAFTTENRDTWANLRNQLRKDTLNARSLSKIESAMFLLCLDDSSPVTREEVGRALWHGDGKNRFFDKSIQFIVFENGKAGFNGEHSMMDATPTSRLCDSLLTNLFENKVNHGESTRDLPAPTRLEFNVNNQLKTAIDIAVRNFNGLVDKHQMAVLVFDNYGKDFIKKVKQSPDAYVQMAMQLGYYKMYGVCRPTYESSQVRKFAYGRTETTRSVSNESVEFVKAMESPEASIESKFAALQRAIKSHTAYMADAVEGKGVDRHFLGLRLIANEMKLDPKPELFQDPNFSYSSTWYLSTSQITSEYYDNYGWGEVIPQGYGIPYMIKENSIHFCVTSQKLHSERLTHYLHEALIDMKNVCSLSSVSSLPSPVSPSAPKAKL